MVKKKSNDSVLYGLCAFISLFIMNFIDVGYGCVLQNTQSFIWLLIIPYVRFNLFFGVCLSWVFSSLAKKFRVHKFCDIGWYFFVIYGIASLLGAIALSAFLGMSVVHILGFVLAHTFVVTVIYMLLIVCAFWAKKFCKDIVYIGWLFFVIYGIVSLLGVFILSVALDTSVMHIFDLVFGHIFVATVIYMLLIICALYAAATKKSEKCHGKKC